MVLADSPAAVLPPDGEQRNLPKCCSKSPTGSVFVPTSTPPITPGSTCSRRIGWKARPHTATSRFATRELKNNFGGERGLDWFKEQRPHQVEEEAGGGLLAPVRRRARAHLLGIHAADRQQNRCDRRAARPQDPDGILPAVAGFPAVHVALLPQSRISIFTPSITATSSTPTASPWRTLGSTKRRGSIRSPTRSRSIAAQAGKRRLDDGQLVWVEKRDRTQGQGPAEAHGGHPSRRHRHRRDVRPLERRHAGRQGQRRVLQRAARTRLGRT